MTGVNQCVCDAGYMDSSSYAICSSAKPCQSGFFCTSEYGGGEGLCLSCGVVPTVAGARCCSAVSSFFNWFTGEPWAKAGFLSKENVQKCYASCGGTVPGLPGSSCTAASNVRQWEWQWLWFWVRVRVLLLLNAVPQPVVPQQARLTDCTPRFLILQSSYYSYYIRLRLTDYTSVLILLYAFS